MAAVPAVVVVRTVLILIAVTPVVLVIVGDQVVQGEAVMGSHIVNALVGVIRVSASVGEKIVAAIDAAHEIGNHACIALNEAANVVAKAAVPLQPCYAGESAAELKRSGIPRLRDQPHFSQLRVAGNCTEQRGVSPVERSIPIATEYRCQIEPESIDMHLLLPIAQAVHHHFADMSATEIQ